jgi:transcriptional regulator with XRE-family HTH domain
MPEIGATLREARMRARIDITEVEEATKIRAKYLRALENEEWSLLPGSTFVKSFLREYAQFLGLDARRLVEEYKLRYERPSEQELAPISPNLGHRERHGPVGGVPPRWAVIAGLVVVLLVALYAIGSWGGSKSGGGGPDTAGPASTPTARTTPERRAATAPVTPAQASVRLIPTGTVYVCLVDASGKVLIRGATLNAGETTRVFRAARLRLTLGNNAVRLRVNGREVPVPPSSQAIAYELTPTGARPLAAAKAPTCT